MAVAAFAVGTALSAYGTIAASQERAESERRQARLREDEAREILARSEIKERQLIREGELFKGQQRVAQSASGVGGESRFSIFADTDYNNRQDIFTLRR